jgi:hypothetical protein
MNNPHISTAEGQLAVYYENVRKQSGADQTFLHLVQTGMTKRDLKRLIERRPSLWARYENWMNKLPDTRPPASVSQ